jgi:hypothetical protein
MSILVYLIVSFLMLLILCFWINVVAHDINRNVESAKEEVKLRIDHKFKELKFEKEWINSLKDKT